MGTVSKIKAQRLLDPANGTLEGQAKVNAEIFTAVEILGRKLERVSEERDRLAQRLALIESQASVDEKTGKLYLPVVVNPETQIPVAAAAPRWIIPASLASIALALFAAGVVLFRPSAPPLTKSQIAVLNALSASQFTQLEADSKKWKTLAEAQQTIPSAPQQSIVTPTIAPPPTTPLAEPAAVAPVPTVKAVPVDTAVTSQPPAQITDTATAAATAPVPSPAPEKTAQEKVAAPETQTSPKVAATETTQTNTAAVKPAVTRTAVAKPATEKTPAKKTAVAKTVTAPVVKTAAKSAVPETAAAGGIAPDTTLTGDLAALQKRAYAGVPAAQHDLATRYAAGNDVPQDYVRARFWFKQAALQGVANASYNLGVIYHQGLGVKADMKKAIYWYKKAADRGHPEAMYNLGISYIEGIGTKTDIPKGVAYFEKAANAGVSQAAYNLGVLYESNFIGPINIPEAVKWYRIAARQGHPQAEAALRRIEGDTLKAGGHSAYADQAVRHAVDITPAAGSNTDEPHTLLGDIQRILIQQGFLTGQPNGALNQQTQAAILAAEKKLGMTQDGQPSESLLDRLLQMPPTMGE